MKRLIQLEYLKNFSYRPFRIFSIIYFLLLGILLFIGLADIKIADGLEINLKDQGIYNFPEIWNFTTYIVALLKIFLGLIIVFSICQEFTNRMFKQNLIDGLSRKEFLTSKVLTILIFSLISTLVVFLITLFIGLNYSERTDSQLITQELYFIGNYFIKLVTFFSFLMFLSILFRKSMFVFLGFFVWWIIEGILKIIENVSRFSNLENPSPMQLKEMKETVLITDFLPLESMSNLIPNPLMRLNMAKILGPQAATQFPTESLVSCLIWLAVFIFGSYWILKKRDW